MSELDASPNSAIRPSASASSTLGAARSTISRGQSSAAQDVHGLVADTAVADDDHVIAHLVVDDGDARFRRPHPRADERHTRNNNSSVIGMRLNISGLTVIDSSAAATIGEYWSESSSPRVTPAWPTMKRNSPIWLSPAAPRPEWSCRRLRTEQAQRDDSSCRPRPGPSAQHLVELFEQITSRTTSIPTDTKNKHGKGLAERPISTSNRWRTVVPPSTTPARNAPSAKDTPKNSKRPNTDTRGQGNRGQEEQLA